MCRIIKKLAIMFALCLSCKSPLEENWYKHMSQDLDNLIEQVARKEELVSRAYSACPTHTSDTTNTSMQHHMGQLRRLHQTIQDKIQETEEALSNFRTAYLEVTEQIAAEGDNALGADRSSLAVLQIVFEGEDGRKEYIMGKLLICACGDEISNKIEELQRESDKHAAARPIATSYGASSSNYSKSCRST